MAASGEHHLPLSVNALLVQLVHCSGISIVDSLRKQLTQSAEQIAEQVAAGAYGSSGKRVAELSLQRAACELCFEAHTRTTREVPSHFVATCAASAIATLREFEALYAAKCAELDALETRHEALQEEHQSLHANLRGLKTTVQNLLGDVSALLQHVAVQPTSPDGTAGSAPEQPRQTSDANGGSSSGDNSDASGSGAHGGGSGSKEDVVHLFPRPTGETGRPQPPAQPPRRSAAIVNSLIQSIEHMSRQFAQCSLSAVAITNEGNMPNAGSNNSDGSNTAVAWLLQQSQTTIQIQEPAEVVQQQQRQQQLSQAQSEQTQEADERQQAGETAIISVLPPSTAPLPSELSISEWGDARPAAAAPQLHLTTHQAVVAGMAAAGKTASAVSSGFAGDVASASAPGSPSGGNRGGSAQQSRVFMSRPGSQQGTRAASAGAAARHLVRACSLGAVPSTARESEMAAPLPAMPVAGAAAAPTSSAAPAGAAAAVPGPLTAALQRQQQQQQQQPGPRRPVMVRGMAHPVPIFAPRSASAGPAAPPRSLRALRHQQMLRDQQERAHDNLVAAAVAALHAQQAQRRAAAAAAGVVAMPQATSSTSLQQQQQTPGGSTLDSDPTGAAPAPVVVQTAACASSESEHPHCSPAGDTSSSGGDGTSDDMVLLGSCSAGAPSTKASPAAALHSTASQRSSPAAAVANAAHTVAAASAVAPPAVAAAGDRSATSSHVASPLHHETAVQRQSGPSLCALGCSPTPVDQSGQADQAVQPCSEAGSAPQPRITAVRRSLDMSGAAATARSPAAGLSGDCCSNNRAPAELPDVAERRDEADSPRKQRRQAGAGGSGDGDRGGHAGAVTTGASAALHAHTALAAGQVDSGSSQQLQQPQQQQASAHDEAVTAVPDKAGSASSSAKPDGAQLLASQEGPASSQPAAAAAAAAVQPPSPSQRLEKERHTGHDDCDLGLVRDSSPLRRVADAHMPPRKKASCATKRQTAAATSAAAAAASAMEEGDAFSLPELLAIVADIMHSKAAADAGLAARRLPPFTPSAHLQRYLLGKVRGDRALYRRALAAMLSGLDEHKDELPTIAVFCRVLSGECDEDYFTRHLMLCAHLQQLALAALSQGPSGAGSATTTTTSSSSSSRRSSNNAGVTWTSGPPERWEAARMHCLGEGQLAWLLGAWGGQRVALARSGGACTSAGPPLAEEQLERLRQEWLDAVMDHCGGRASSRTAGAIVDALLMWELRAHLCRLLPVVTAFKAADGSGRGVLDMQQFLVFSASLNPDMQRSQAELLYRQLDAIEAGVLGFNAICRCLLPAL